MELSNASFLPDPNVIIRGSVTFEWAEGGDFLVMRQGTKGGGMPWAIWKIWRNAPKFSQKFVGTLSKNKKAIKAHWGKSLDGRNGQHDFDMTYRRIET